MNGLLEVSEIFGPTLQGEGPSAGKKATFLRLRRCNLACSWCDTRYTWDKTDPGYQKYELLDVSGVTRELKAHSDPSTELLVITGGEPLLWKRQILLMASSWIQYLHFRRIEIETAGTIPCGELGFYPYVYFNVSLKLTSSGNLRTLWKKDVIQEFVRLANDGHAVFKFVVTPETLKVDVGEISAFQQEYKVNERYISVMAEGVTVERQLLGMQALSVVCIQNGWRLTPRLHVLTGVR